MHSIHKTGALVAFKCIPTPNRSAQGRGGLGLSSDPKEFRRRYGVHVHKQATICPYVVDSVIHANSLVIDVDGEHHFLPDQMVGDTRRDGWLSTKGYRVLRLTTTELSDSFNGCIEEILRALGLMEEAVQSR